MADAALGVSRLGRLVAGAGIAAVVVAIAVSALLGSPVLVLVTAYAVAFGAAILLFGDDRFARAVNGVIATGAGLLVFLCTRTPIPNAPIQGLPLTDRLNYYYIYYIGTGMAGIQEAIEPGFLLLVNACRRIMAFEVFLAFAALGVLASLLALLSAVGQRRAGAVLALVLLSYFAFWSGALNITRQFVAAGIAVAAVVALVRSEGRASWLRGAAFVILIAAAASVHASALVFAIFGILYPVRRHGRALLGAIWAGNVLVFALNVVGFPPLALIPGLSDRLARYDSSQISDESLAQFQSAGVTIGNRPDWAVAIALPMAVYAVALLLRRGARVEAEAEVAAADARGLFLLALLYTALAAPFYLLSFLAFGDRVAFYAFLLLPVFLVALLTAGFGREVRFVALVGLAGGCIVQMALGLYGYTPKWWLIGLP